MDGRTDDGRKVITIAHPEQSSGELKKESKTLVTQLQFVTFTSRMGVAGFTEPTFPSLVFFNQVLEFWIT